GTQSPERRAAFVELFELYLREGVDAPVQRAERLAPDLWRDLAGRLYDGLLAHGEETQAQVLLADLAIEVDRTRQDDQRRAILEETRARAARQGWDPADWEQLAEVAGTPARRALALANAAECRWAIAARATDVDRWIETAGAFEIAALADPFGRPHQTADAAW